MKVEPTLLNPFPFAGETGFRLIFLLMIASTVALSAGFHVLGAFAPSIMDVETCLVTRVAPILQDVSLDVNISTVTSVRTNIDLCVSSLFGGSLVVWPLTLFASFAFTMIGGLLLSRCWIIRRAGLVQLPEPLCDMIHARTHALSEAMGIQERPEILWAPLDPKAGAFVFGSNRGPVVALTSGTVANGLSDPMALDAVLAHELAHVANREVTSTLVARAAVAALLAVVWPLYLLLALAEPNEPETLRYALAGDPASIRFMAFEILRLVLITGLVLIVANSVYRARERLADLRASLAPELLENLREQLREMPDPSFWQRAFSRHPPGSKRVLGLESAHDMFAFGWATPFSMSFAISFATPVTMLTWLGLLQYWFISLVDTGSSMLLAMVVVAPITILAVPLGAAMVPIAWRSWHASMMQRNPVDSVVGPALAAAVGAIVGLGGSAAAVVFFTSTPGAGSPMPSELSSSVTSAGTVLVLIFFFYWLYLLWLRNVALSWTPVLAGRKNGPATLRWLFPLSALPLVLIIPPTLILGAIIPFMVDFAVVQGLPPGSFILGLLIGTAGVVALNPFSPLVLLILALLPLASWLFRRDAEADWPFIRGMRLDRPTQKPLRPVLAVMAGAVWGFGLFAATKAGTWQSAMIDAGIASPNSMVLALALMLALVALPVSAVAPSLRVEHGILAAMVAALVCVGTLYDMLGSGNLLGKWILVSGAPILGLLFGFLGAVLRLASSQILLAGRHLIR